MKTKLTAIVLCIAATASAAQNINLWRGGEIKADWNDPYKWKLQHVPKADETIHFRQANSVITINSTIDLDNGMMLYGQDLFLEGHGNINLWSPIPHKSTVNIPASATGYANLTLSGTLALNGRIALAAKAFGTSASKGSVTIKDRATITGKLAIGNNGSGSGQVYIQDQAIYRISGLELHTLADKGGAAEIHVLGGTAHLEAGTDPFEAFLTDPCRKIIISENGTLRIDSDWPIPRKTEIIAEMISKKSIVAASRCQLTTPVVQEEMILLKAEFIEEARPKEAPADEISKVQQIRNMEPAKSKPQTKADTTADTAADPSAKPKVAKLKNLLQDMRTNQQPATAVEAAPKQSQAMASPESPVDEGPLPLAGYIAFFSAILFFMRPQKPGE